MAPSAPGCKTYAELDGDGEGAIDGDGDGVELGEGVLDGEGVELGDGVLDGCGVGLTATLLWVGWGALGLGPDTVPA